MSVEGIGRRSLSHRERLCGGVAPLFSAGKFNSSGKPFFAGGLPFCCESGMVWAIGKYRSFNEHNFEAAAQALVNPKLFINLTVLCHLYNPPCELHAKCQPEHASQSIG